MKGTLIAFKKKVNKVMEEALKPYTKDFQVIIGNNKSKEEIKKDFLDKLGNFDLEYLHNLI